MIAPGGYLADSSHSQDPRRHCDGIVMGSDSEV